MRFEQETTLDLLGTPPAAFPLDPRAAAAPDLGRPWQRPLHGLPRSVLRRLAGALSRKVVGDLCLTVHALLIGATGFLCHVVYYRHHLGVEPRYETYLYLGSFAACLFLLISIAVFHISYSVLRQFRQAMAKTTLAFLLTVMCLLLLAFLTQTSATYSRGSFLAWTVASCLLLLVGNYLFAHHLARAAWLRRCLVRNVVIVGATDLTARFLRHLRASGERDVRVLGIFDQRGDPARWRRSVGCRGVPYRGDLDDLVEHIIGHEVDEILIALPWHAERRIGAIVERLSHLAVDIKLCPDRVGYVQRPVFTEVLAGALVTTVHAQPIRDWGLIFKAALDLVLSAALLVALAPLLVLIAVLIRCDTPGPVLFRQRRHGFNHDVFDLYKFRTMHHQPGAAFIQARPGDPRVTRVGRWLRRLSLDELPQLLNVLRGEMSLVGPRPHPVALNLEFMERIKRYATRHRVKPGITGWAQVNGWRGRTDSEAKMAGRLSHDLHYIENWSLMLDLKILALTLVTGFGCKNAH